MPTHTAPHRLLADLAAAWRVRPVRLGLLGTFLIALGALSPAYLPRASSWWQWLTPLHANGTAWRVGGTILTMLGALLLVDAWFRLRPASLREDDRHPHRGLKANLLSWWQSINSAPVVATDEGKPLLCRGWAVLFWWALPLLVAPPVFSQDAYSYAAQGWIVHNGLDPYAVGPGMLPGSFADQVASEWRMTPAPYGPLSLQISHLLVVVCGYSPYLSAWAQRLPALLGVVMIGFFLPRIARQMRVDEHLAVWFALLNPMLVISFIGGAHNDALMMGFVVAGIWVAGLGLGHGDGSSGPPLDRRAERRFGLGLDHRLQPTQGAQAPSSPHNTLHGPPGQAAAVSSAQVDVPPPSAPRSSPLWWLLGAVVVGIGATIKQPAVLTALALPLITRPWASWAWRDTLITAGRVIASLATSVATFCLITVATRLGFGWVNSVSVPGRSLTAAPFTMVGLAVEHVVGWFGVTLDQTHTVAMARLAGIVIGALLIAFLALTLARRRPIAFLAWGYLAAALCAPALRTWYVQWSVTLLPLTHMSATMVRVAVWGTLVMFGFDAMYMSMRNSAVAVGVGALLAMAWVAWNHLPLLDRRKP